MATKENPPFARGATYFGTSTVNATDGANLEGQTWEFEDVTWDQSGVKNSRTGRTVTCMVVRNTSGVTLTPKRLVSLKKSGGNPVAYTGQVDGYGLDPAQSSVFPVDEFLPAAGVVNNDLFWVVINGPAMCTLPIGPGNAAFSFSGNTGTINIGDPLIAATAVTSQATSAGRVQVQAVTLSPTATTDGSAINQISNRIGFAMSARTSGNTGGVAAGTILVDIRKW